MVNSQELNKTISELEKQVKKFKSISEVYSELTALKSDLVSLKDQSSDNSIKLKVVTDKLDNKLATYEKLLNELSKDNKGFQKELEQHITSKLDKHKSDIQVEIRNEGSQIQRGFENSLTLNFNNLQAKLNEYFLSQEEKIKSLKIILYFTTAFTIGILLLLLVKLAPML